MRKRNAASILRAVRKTPGLSRADVARSCDLAKSTVSSIVDELVQLSVVQESGYSTSIRGRRPTGLLFNSAARVTIGISLDDDRIDLAMSDLDGKVLAVRRKKYARKLDLNSIILLLLTALDQLLTTEKTRAEDVVGLGLAVPGPVSETAIPRINGKKLDIPGLTQRLAGVLPCAVIVDSNTNMLAICETIRGAAQSSDDAFIVRHGREIRSAIVKDKKLLRGNHALAGNFGHLRIPGVDAICICGERGCVNSLAGAEAIVHRCWSRKSTIKELDDVISLALDGDKKCRAALADAGKAIAYGLSGAINIIAPSDVIVTGKIVSAGDLLIEPLKFALRQHASPGNLQNCNLIFSNYQKHSEAIGSSLAPLYQDDFLMRLVVDEFEAETRELQRV